MNGNFKTGGIKPENDRSTYYIIASFIVIILLLAFRKFLALIGINLFIFLDKLLSFGKSIPVLIGWVLLGLCIGLMYGAWVAFRKYRLKISLLVPYGALTGLFVLILFAINKPLKNVQPPFEVKTTDAYAYVDVNSTGYLKPNGHINYSHYNLIDQSDSTAWIENSKYSGLGHEIDFTFITSIGELKNCKCIGFIVKNGYEKSQKIWQNHNRVKEFKLYHNGSYITALTAADVFNVTETMSIAPIEIKAGDRLTLLISAVYSGKKNQTAITELVPVIQYEE